MLRIRRFICLKFPDIPTASGEEKEDIFSAKLISV